VYGGGSYTLRASVRDRFGNTRSDPVAYAAPAAAASVQAGTVKGEAIGRGHIDVSGAGLTGSAVLSVVPQGTIALHDFGLGTGSPAGYAVAGLNASGVVRVVPETAPTEYAPNSAGAPQWLSGGTSFVFPKGGRLFVAELSGATRPLIPGPSAVLSESEAAVSPDGTWVYFAGQQDAGTAIWRVHPDGTGAESVPGPVRHSIRWLTVSPDGTRLAYVAADFGGEYRLFVRTIANGTTTQVGTNEAAGARWAPSGERIVYALSGASPGYSGVLHVVNADGSDDRVFTAGPFYPGVDWSPDGKYLIGVRADVFGAGLRVIGFETGEQLPIVVNGAWYAPTWRR